MKPNLPIYFLIIVGICFQGLLWLGQIKFYPEVNVWTHLFLSIAGVILASICLIILAIQTRSTQKSIPKISLLILLAISSGLNSLWFFVICMKQILKL